MEAHNLARRVSENESFRSSDDMNVRNPPWHKKELRFRPVYLGVICALILIIIGVLAGLLANCRSESIVSPLDVEAAVRSPPNRPFDQDSHCEFKDASEIVGQLNAENIRENLRFLSAQPHIAASSRDRELTKWIYDNWLQSGLDNVKLPSYDFLISKPVRDNPNKIHILDRKGSKIWTSRHMEEVENPDPNYIHAFNAYAPQGTVSGELVYVNYGRIEDVLELKKLNVNLEGKIALVRYGKIFRGSKVVNCARFGAIGVILYSDPAEVAREGVEDEDVYPNTFFLPESGIQRGSVCEGDGDPLSPDWSSIKGAYRLKNLTAAIDNVCFTGLKGIPSQPIGYGDARNLLEKMGGEEVPEEWKGDLANITYRLGPGFNSQFKDHRVELVVNNVLENVNSSNVIGMIQGSEEPDRYVIIGNHRDSWGYGAADPSSGTAALMEIVRVFGAKVKAGWRPRRSIVFASWAVEEYGLEGSVEYVYENLHTIQSRGVANLNLDTCVAGSILRVSASSALKNVFTEAAKQVADPDNDTQTLYESLDAYNKKDPSPKVNVEGMIKLLGAGSDHATFTFFTAIPAVYFRFEPDKQKYPGLTGYPVYHTGFDTFDLMNNILDPTFNKERTCAQLISHMAINLAESAFLPYNLTNAVVAIKDTLSKFETDGTAQWLRLNEVGELYDTLNRKFLEFSKAVQEWELKVEKLRCRTDKTFSMRIASDQVMNLEKIFLMTQGLPGRPDVRHALFSPSKFDAYGGASLPGLVDLLWDKDDLAGIALEERREEVKRHVSDLMIMFSEANSWLNTFPSK